MTYPQPNADKALINGNQVFRLRTKLVSAGDTYDSTQSGYAFAIGPDSDIANVDINYFDASLPTRMNQVSIGAGSPYVGLIQARNEPSSLYQPQGTQGRIIFSIGDIVPVLFEPLGFPAPPENQVRVSPILDILQYFSAPPSGIVSARNDRHYFFATPDTSALTNGVMIYEVPYYGRKYACISAYNANAVAGGSIKIEGLRFGFGVADLLAPSTTQLLTTTPLASGTIGHEVDALTDGEFDYLRISIAAGAPDLVTLDIKMSDTPG